MHSQELRLRPEPMAVTNKVCQAASTQLSASTIMVYIEGNDAAEDTP